MGAVGGAALIGFGSVPETAAQVASEITNYVEFIDGTGETAPASGRLRLSAKTLDKMPYIMDDSGVETIVVTRQVASYVIELIGNTVYARPAPNSGLTPYSGSNAATVINNALAGLTSGRTYKQRVVIVGDISITAPINVPSYTIFEIQGRITASVDMAYMIGNSNQAGGDVQIEIQGGQVNGNGQLASGHVLIQLKNVTDGLIDDVYGCNTYQGGGSFGFYLWYCNGVDVKKCLFSLCYGSAVEISGCLYCNAVDCKATDCGPYSAAFEVYGGAASTPSIGCRVVNCTAIFTGAVTANFGIELCSYSYSCSVIGGTVIMPVNPGGVNGWTGVMLGDETGDTCLDLTAVGVTVRNGRVGVSMVTSSSACVGCTIYRPSVAGVASDANTGGVIPSHNNIIGNVINQPSLNSHGIDLYANNSTVQGNTLTSYAGGLAIDVFGNHNIVSENQVDSWCIGIQIESGATGNQVHDNFVLNPGCGASNNLNNSGTSTVIRNNVGYNPQSPFSPTLPGTGVAFPLLSYDANYVVTSATGITGLTLDGTAVSYATGAIIFVPAQHNLIPTYSGTPTFKILPM